MFWKVPYVWYFYGSGYTMCGDYAASCPISGALHRVYAPMIFLETSNVLAGVGYWYPNAYPPVHTPSSYLTFFKHILLWTSLVHSCPYFGVPLKTCFSCLCSPRYCVCYIHEEFNRLLQVLKKNSIVSHENCNCTCHFCASGNCHCVFTSDMDLYWFMRHCLCTFTTPQNLFPPRYLSYPYLFSFSL